MSADLDIAMAQFARDHLDPLLVGGIINPQHLLGQQLAESLVYLADGVQGCGAASHPAPIDPALDLDVRPRFKLEVALFNVLAVIVFEGAFDIDGVRVVPFDQIAAIAIHRARPWASSAAEAALTRPERDEP